jgi:hypothetical protein
VNLSGSGRQIVPADQTIARSRTFPLLAAKFTGYAFRVEIDPGKPVGRVCRQAERNGDRTQGRWVGARIGPDFAETLVLAEVDDGQP